MQKYVEWYRMDSDSTWSSAGRGVILGSLHLPQANVLLGPEHRIIFFLPPPAGYTTWQNHHHHAIIILRLTKWCMDGSSGRWWVI